jgi:hypothetical protein
VKLQSQVKNMDHIEALFHDLSRIATSMEHLTKKPDAKVFYDTLSGSIVWTDELPKSTAISLDCLRFVLKYRTGLLVGEPEPSFQLFWQEAQLRFPNWIGFSLERTSYDDELKKYYTKERKRVTE